jgi:hypothetical protein
MMYFPKSQITPNLYTNGGDLYIKSTGQEYKGYYYKTSTGLYFSGRNPNDSPNQELIIIDDSYWNATAQSEKGKNFIQIADNFDGYVFENQLQQPKTIDTYASLTPPFEPTFIPYYSPVLPTEQDYSIGEFRRYFCKKLNELKYIEINKTQYDLLVSRDKQILFQLYKPFYLNWI